MYCAWEKSCTTGQAWVGKPGQASLGGQAWAVLAPQSHCVGSTATVGSMKLHDLHRAATKMMQNHEKMHKRGRCLAVRADNWTEFIPEALGSLWDASRLSKRPKIPGNGALPWAEIILLDLKNIPWGPNFTPSPKSTIEQGFGTLFAKSGLRIKIPTSPSRQTH